MSARWRSATNALLGLSVLSWGAMAGCHATTVQPDYVMTTAHESPTDVRTALTTLEHLNDQLARTSDPTTQTMLRAQMEHLAAERQEALETLAQTSPQRVLALAITSEARDRFPASVQQELETVVDLEGIVEMLIEDRFGERTSITHYTLMTGPDRYTLYFLKEPIGLQPGAPLKIRGLQVGHSLIISE